MSSRRTQAAPVKLAAVVTASTDVEPGQPLGAAVLTTGQMTPGSVPTGAFESPAALDGRIALTRLVKGQPVLESMLAPVGEAAGVQALIPPGMRAITIEVTEFSGLRGLLAPGCRVDIISVVPAGDGTQNSLARTIVQNVEVRAIGQQIARAAPAPSGDTAAPAGDQANSVTLLVTPTQAEAVQLASSGSRPWLVLRNARDGAPFDTHGTSLADLRGDEAKGIEPGTELVEAKPQPDPDPATDPFEEKPTVPAPPASPRTREVRFIKGTKEETVKVDLGPELTETITTNDTGDVVPGAK
jgi:pilus assembly protein CpaB